MGEIMEFVRVTAQGQAKTPKRIREVAHIHIDNAYSVHTMYS